MAKSDHSHTESNSVAQVKLCERFGPNLAMASDRLESLLCNQCCIGRCHGNEVLGAGVAWFYVLAVYSQSLEFDFDQGYVLVSEKTEGEWSYILMTDIQDIEWKLEGELRPESKFLACTGKFLGAGLQSANVFVAGLFNRNHGKLFQTFEERPQLIEIYAKLEDELLSDRPFKLQALAAFWMQFYVICGSLKVEQEGDKPVKVTIYEKVLALLPEGKVLEAEEVMKELNLSERKINKSLKTYCGRSLKELLKDHQLDVAKRLLLTTQMTASEVAYEAKFNSTSYFSRAFKKKFELTPQSFRKKLTKVMNETHPSSAKSVCDRVSQINNNIEQSN